VGRGGEEGEEGWKRHAASAREVGIFVPGAPFLSWSGGSNDWFSKASGKVTARESSQNFGCKPEYCACINSQNWPQSDEAPSFWEGVGGWGLRNGCQRSELSLS
jgi:hypothetical protein